MKVCLQSMDTVQDHWTNDCYRRRYMGQWLFNRINASKAFPLTDAGSIGHKFSVSFYLTYKPGPTNLLDKAKRANPFVETPKLEWLESITMKETGAVKGPEFWKFQTNMYQHNPASASLIAWRQRYILAYNYVAKEPAPLNVKGFVQLMSARNGIVSLNDLGGRQPDNQSKATAVRTYIENNGCEMIINLEDIPSILTTADFLKKERLLEFDIGLKGGGQRVKAYQKLEVTKSNGQVTNSNPIFEFEPAPPDIILDPGGHGQKDPPDSVAKPRFNQPFLGEYD
jgi:hypothetical protein